MKRDRGGDARGGRGFSNMLSSFRSSKPGRQQGAADTRAAAADTGAESKKPRYVRTSRDAYIGQAAMGEVNFYARQLTRHEIQRGEHRSFIGGMWDEIGDLQFEFMKQQGLKSHHRFGDVGCGALRGGVKFIPYLDTGNYYGLDINASCIDAARHEIKHYRLEHKHAHLLVDDGFRMGRFDAKFDFCIGVSLFTHLPMNHILRCLLEVQPQLTEDGVFFATFFLADDDPNIFLRSVHQPGGGVVTSFDSDPYHYTLRQVRWLAAQANLTAEEVPWNHPRNQKMIGFRSISQDSTKDGKRDTN